MRECVLLFQFERTRQKKLVAQLLLAKFRVKIVRPEELNLPVGYLAGNKEIIPKGTGIKPEDGPKGEPGTKDGQADGAGGNAPLPLDSEMLVMAGLTPDRLDAALQAIRKAGIGPIPYKAALTETNQNWKARDLLEELKKEHEAMKEADRGGKMLHKKN